MAPSSGLLPLADRALDLFKFLGALNKRDLQAYTKLTDEAKKEASALVIQRWLSGTSDPAQIIRLNEVANPYIFALGSEKELLFKLLAAACTGRVNRTSWIKGPGSSTKRLSLVAIEEYYQCSQREAEEYLPRLDASDILRFAEDAGWDKDQIKKLTAELK